MTALTRQSASAAYWLHVGVDPVFPARRGESGSAVPHRTPVPAASAWSFRARSTTRGSARLAPAVSPLRPKHLVQSAARGARRLAGLRRMLPARGRDDDQRGSWCVSATRARRSVPRPPAAPQPPRLACSARSAGATTRYVATGSSKPLRHGHHAHPWRPGARKSCLAPRRGPAAAIQPGSLQRAAALVGSRPGTPAADVSGRRTLLPALERALCPGNRSRYQPLCGHPATGIQQCGNGSIGAHHRLPLAASGNKVHASDRSSAPRSTTGRDARSAAGSATTAARLAQAVLGGGGSARRPLAHSARGLQQPDWATAYGSAVPAGAAAESITAERRGTPPCRDVNASLAREMRQRPAGRRSRLPTGRRRGRIDRIR